MEAFIQNHFTSFPILILILIVAAMLFTLSKGADILVDESISLSLHWGVPKVIIGATIISLGTTLPEASVSVLAALNGNPDLALGNAIGSIITNAGLILGLAALLGRIPIDRTVVGRQGNIQVGVGILLAIVSLPFLSGGAEGNITQWAGWIFIVLLISYIYLSMKWTKTPKNAGATASSGEAGSTEEILVEEKSPIALQLLKMVAGIALVIVSSKILIPTVEIIATRIGIPQSIIAATLIAFGTSLPELVTSITAVRKGHGELAIGNVVGANILNVLFVVGSAAAVTRGGLHVPVNFYKLQIPTMLIILLSFRYFVRGKNEELTKKAGLFLFAVYSVYLILNYTWI